MGPRRFSSSIERRHSARFPQRPVRVHQQDGGTGQPHLPRQICLVEFRDVVNRTRSRAITAKAPGVNEDRGLRQRAFYFSRIYADPKERDTLYVLNVELYKSTDAGDTWTLATTPGPAHDWADLVVWTGNSLTGGKTCP